MATTTKTTTVKYSYDKVTDRQYAYAESLARKAGYKRLSDARRDMHGKNKIGDMKRAECSALIDWLLAR